MLSENTKTVLAATGAPRDPTKGPRGGNINDPKRHPEARRAEFRGQELPGGGLSLHRFEPKIEAAQHGRVNEQGWQRMAAFMVVKNFTNEEIAAAAGVVPSTVSQLKGNLWFQELVAQLANDAGQSVLDIIHAEAMKSVHKIVEIRDNSESDRVALAAATTLLEHSKGKPMQSVMTAVTHVNATSPAQRASEIQAELARIRAHREQLQGVKPVETPSVQTNQP